MDDINVTPVLADSSTVENIQVRPQRPPKTAADWVRDMRMSPEVNKTTVGVETDRITPELLMATSSKLLGISRREQDPDPKDSLLFQRFYGPAEYFAEHILRDGSKVARNLLWKATNKGKIDFVPSGALDQHVSDVFYSSKLAQMIDGSSPLETVDASFKTTRVGEGGVADVQSAPDEMRTVQPSYFGYLDSVRCYAADTELMTKKGWKFVSDITEDDELACYVNDRLEYHKPTALNAYDYKGKMYGYKGTHISYLVTPNHRMHSRCYGELRDGRPCAYNIRTAESIHGKNRVVDSACHLPLLCNEDQKYFELPVVGPNLKKEQVHGNPPMGANLKNVDKVDIVKFAEFLGWYLTEGSYCINETRGYYRVDIAQSPEVSAENYEHIRQLIESLPFNATNPDDEEKAKRGGHTLSIARKQLTMYVSQFGKCEDKYIPEWIFSAPLQARKAFCWAMLQGDGRRQRHLCTKSKRLADDFARLLFELGESAKVYHETETRYKDHPGIWVTYWHTRKERLLAGKTYRHKEGEYFTEDYTGKVYCPTVPGGLVYCRRGENSVGFWCGNSPERLRVGLDMYMTKNVIKGSDGKLYQRFINARTGKEELVDSVTASRSIVAAPEMMDADTKSIFALGGRTGVRIVPKDKVDYYLPRADDAYSMSSNMVPMFNGVKEMRLLMGCLHPGTPLITISAKNEINIKPAKSIGKNAYGVPGCDDKGKSLGYLIRNSIAKFPQKRKWFKKVVLMSGRSLITSYDHRWPVLRDNKLELVNASDLQAGDKVLRSTFKDLPNRRTFLRGVLVNKDVATLLGCIVRSVTKPETDKLRVVYQSSQKKFIEAAIERLKLENSRFYSNAGEKCLAIHDSNFIQWVEKEICLEPEERKVPTVILSACLDIASHFIDAYTADTTKVGIDSNEDMWILDIPSMICRDGLALLLARMQTDTLYRDAVRADGVNLALKLVEQAPTFGDSIVDEVKIILEVEKVPLMIDIDIDDNMYATANGVITHNSKYPLQAISLLEREAPLVRGLDEASGRDIPSLAGKYLGARFANQGGTVTAVRKDRIDVVYDDGTKGSVSLYQNFPMNAKGYITNTPVVKAGQSFKKGDVLAASNYTDDKGVAAIGKNLRSGWLSWKGGTYEDAVVISESAAKKLTSRTMYKSAVDLDKTVSLGKKNYVSWKPSEYTKDQLSALDDNGIIKPGSVLRKGDPMILAVQTSEPSPGTLGKRVLTDISETWEHDHPGVVTDVVKTRKGVKVFAVVEAPAEVGDKVSGNFGNKGVVSQLGRESQEEQDDENQDFQIQKIVPDAMMPIGEDGKPLDLLFSPLGLISRTNASQIHEALLGKVARKTGKPFVMPAFYKGDLTEFVENQLKQNKVSDTEDLTDPYTGRKIPKVLTGVSYIYKLKHQAESKLSARGTAEYTAEGTPGGSGLTGSKRYGTLEQSAMVGHGAFDNLLDAKLLRGQSNSDFWRSIRTGEIPTIPGEPLVHKKFFAHLTGSGVNVRKTPKGISVFSLSNDDVKELAGPRELKSKDTYEAKTFRPIDGGLFGQDLFGPNGDRWAYIQLDEPLPNPVMEEPLARLLRLSTKDFMAVAAGKAEVNGMKSSADIKERLARINLKAEEQQAKQEFKDAPMSKKDAALKRYRDIARMAANEVSPDQYMLDRIPVLPPVFRPVSTHNGLTMVADSNYLYAQMLDARDDAREARNLPKEYQQQARENLYRSWKELTGMYDPENVKLKNKHVRGLLKWALGDSPKWSAFQRKVLGSTVDTVGRGVITPDPRLKLNQLGVPLPMALGIYEPFVARSMVKQGYSPVEAMKMIKVQDKRVIPVLLNVMKNSPVQLNRAPSLHKLNIMGFEPVLTAGHSVRVNPSIVVPFAADFDGNCCDFDSVIFLKLSKSALDNSSFMIYIDHSNKPEQDKEVSMVTENERVVVFNPDETDPDTVYCAMKIGEFPRKGVPVKDRNGALVYPVPEGVSVLSCDPVTGSPKFCPVSAVTVEENCHTVELTLGSRKIIVSDNESLAAFDSKAGTLIKVSPAEIGDRMVPVLKKQQLPWGPFGTRDLGWMFGAFISDGWVTHNMVGYAKVEANKRAEFVRIMRAYHENFTCNEYADRPQAGKNKLGASVKLHLCSKSLADWMRNWQLVNEEWSEVARAALRKQINSKMIQYGSEDFLWGLFSGLLDGDGSISKNTTLEKPRFTARFSTSSKQLADDICALCYRLGLRYSMTVVPPRGFSNTAYIIIPSTIDLHAKLDKLTCIGEREIQLISEWKQQPASKDTKDMIPLSVKEAEVLIKLANARKDVGVSSGIYKTRKKSCIYGGRIGLMRYCEDIKEMFPDLYARIKNEDTIWQTVTSVEDAGNRQVFDLMVEGTKVFAINNGVIIWDTANVHVPVSDNARRETYEKMFPERNLISMRDRKVLYKPEKEYMQGLYVATRMKKGKDVRPKIFGSVEEARQALRKGIIDIDDPIEIRKQ